MKAESVVHIDITGFKRLSQDSDNPGFKVPIYASKIISTIKLEMLEWPKEYQLLIFRTYTSKIPK